MIWCYFQQKWRHFFDKKADAQKIIIPLVFKKMFIENAQKIALNNENMCRLYQAISSNLITSNTRKVP
jgi:hypothetical protein